MNFMFEWQEQHLMSEHSERVRYCSCHSKTKFISSSQRVMFFLLYKHMMTALLMISEDFRRFSKIVPKARRTFPKIFREFPKISEDGLPKTFEEDTKMFR